MCVKFLLILFCILSLFSCAGGENTEKETQGESESRAEAGESLPESEPESTEAQTEEPTTPDAQKQGGCGALIHLNILLLGCAAAPLLIKKKHY